MLSLVSVNDLIQVITGSAVSTIFVAAASADESTVTSPYVRQNTAISTATTTPVVGSPATQTTRVVKELSIFNSSALSCFIEIQLVNNVPSIVSLFSYTLLTGEQIVYGEEEFIVVSAAGLIKKRQALGF
jgi:hypothetical protein